MHITATDVIAALGVIGLAYYCIETRRIRIAANAQLEALHTPCLTFAAMPRDANGAILDRDGARGMMILNFDEGDAMLHNIGNGPAVNIEYALTPLDGGIPRMDGYVSSIPPQARATLPISRNSLQSRRYECVKALLAILSNLQRRVKFFAAHCFAISVKHVDGCG